MIHSNQTRRIMAIRAGVACVGLALLIPNVCLAQAVVPPDAKPDAKPEAKQQVMALLLTAQKMAAQDMRIRVR